MGEILVENPRGIHGDGRGREGGIGRAVRKHLPGWVWLLEELFWHLAKVMNEGYGRTFLDRIVNFVNILLAADRDIIFIVKDHQWHLLSTTTVIIEVNLYIIVCMMYV